MIVSHFELAVRKLTILKLTALFIFVFELLAPVVLAESGQTGSESELILLDGSSTPNLFLALLCEEAGSEEEREGKEQRAIIIFTEVNFGAAFQYFICQNNLRQPQVFSSKIHSCTSLLSFLKTYRI